MIKPFPVAEIEPTNYSERFQQWARQFGIFRLARSLEVDCKTVRRWFGTTADRPKIDNAKTIIALSSVEPLDGKPLTFEDIYGPARAARVEVRQIQNRKAWE